MLEYLPSNEDVIAIRCGGTLERGELQALMDRLDAALDARPKTHLYGEVVDFSALDTGGLGEMVKRGGRHLTKLDRFGRVAVVADQSWIRHFDPDREDEALAWIGARPVAERFLVS